MKGNPEITKGRALGALLAFYFLPLYIETFILSIMNTNRAKRFLSGYRWIITGIMTGLIFYLVFGPFLHYWQDEEAVERSILFGAVYWALVGLGGGASGRLAMDLGYEGKNWIIQGLLWGLTMFGTVTLAVPYFVGDEITSGRVMVGLITFLIGGLGYGYAMKLIVKDHSPEESI